MKCISPLNILNPTISKDKLKNLSEVKKRLNVPCGKCINCLATKRNEWTFRLYQEQKVAKSALFLTLTYSQDNVIYSNTEETLYKKDLQDFIKKLRYQQKKKCQSKIRYYAVGEYGTETDRPHYHAAMFNLDKSIIKELNQYWEKGFAHIGDLNPASIRYLTKYLINRVGEYETKEKPFALMSRRPGIGNNYLSKTGQYHKKLDKTTVRNDQGQTMAMPRYYREKIFSPIQRAVQTKKQQNEALVEEQRQYNDYKKRGLDHTSLKDQLQQRKIEIMESKLNKKNKI